jgi:hypothetical protein
MKALRILAFLLVLAVALAPMVLHFSVIAPLLVHHGQRHVAVISLVGAVAWYALWLRALPSFSVPQVGWGES